MLKKLIKFLILLKHFKRKDSSVLNLPDYIENPEKIIRVLFFPNNITNDENSIKANAYRTPAGKDEVSVIRLDFCSLTFCKKYGKAIQDPNQKRTFFGFALLTAKTIRNCGANIIYTPKNDNVYHSDIKIGFIPTKGEQLPSEYKYKVDEMARASKLYRDPNTVSVEWEGKDVNYS